ncbi:hypothetical protein [Nocardia brasiliensis]|uniref:hypothetical protein n=1 Tax=Nocardia brasiliensis TaxID=37326 RepID=UPI00366F4716
MLANRASAMAEGMADYVVHLWGLGPVDGIVPGLACVAVDPGDGRDGEAPILEHAAQLVEQVPALWGFGISWVGWVEAFASPEEIPAEAKVAAALGTLCERPTAKQVVGATVYDGRGGAHTSYIHLHAPELGTTHLSFDTHTRASELVADFNGGSIAAQAWAAALHLDQTANRAALAVLRSALALDEGSAGLAP